MRFYMLFLLIQLCSCGSTLRKINTTRKIGKAINEGYEAAKNLFLGPSKSKGKNRKRLNAPRKNQKKMVKSTAWTADRYIYTVETAKSGIGFAGIFRTEFAVYRFLQCFFNDSVSNNWFLICRNLQFTGFCSAGIWSFHCIIN